MHFEMKQITIQPVNSESVIWARITDKANFVFEYYNGGGEMGDWSHFIIVPEKDLPTLVAALKAAGLWHPGGDEGDAILRSVEHRFTGYDNLSGWLAANQIPIDTTSNGMGYEPDV